MYLNNHSYYSLRYGTLSPERLIGLFEDHGIRQFVLTDINNTSAIMNTVRLGQQKGIKVIPGIDFRDGINQKYVGVARNNHGFYQLNQFLSDHLEHNKNFPDRAPVLEDVFFIYPYPKYPEEQEDHEWIGITPAQLNHYHIHHRKVPFEKTLLLATLTFENKNDYNAHRLLRAIHHNTLLSKLPSSQVALQADRFRTPAKLKEITANHPHLLYHAEKLLEQCAFEMSFIPDASPKNPSTYTGSEAKDDQLLRKLSYEGIPYRYPQATEEIFERIEQELEVIKSQGFISYFLINQDIVQYARNRNFFYIGRGSGANSIIAYLLRITDVDPIELNLYFERFINLYRQTPPDFDLDFSWDERDEVIDYIFRRFSHVSLLAAYSTFQYRAVIRELGKVFGLPAEEIDALSAHQKNRGNSYDEHARLVMKYAEYIHDFPSHLTIHAGGVLISEKPVHYYGATFMPPKGFRTIQFDMIVAEDIGLYKFDILSQRGLPKIRDAIKLIRANQAGKPDIDIHNMRFIQNDPATKRQLATARAIGCFYIESPAMRILLTKLNTDHYPGLVAASSIIRPGVARSGMMQEYIRRHNNPAQRQQAHPELYAIMPETYGIMVYQEDVLKVAHHFAGLSLAEADVLRRGMSGKYRSRREFKQVREKFYQSCIKKGHPEKLTQMIWKQIESFAGYAFAKGHSASYAVESFQSLYLKARYPLEYMVSVLNHGGGFYAPEFYIHEIRMNGGVIHPPSINQSQWYATIQGHDIYLGFSFLHELEQSTARQMIEERRANGSFAGLGDFISRIELAPDQLRILIRAGAFRFTGLRKRQLLWLMHRLFKSHQPKTRQQQLFELPGPKASYNIPLLPSTIYEEAFDQIELLGFPLISPFALLQEPIHWQLPVARDLVNLVGRRIRIAGYVVTIKKTRTIHNELMLFGCFLDQHGYFFDTTHFPNVVRLYPFKSKGVYLITGTVENQQGAINITVQQMTQLPMMADPRFNEKELPPYKQLANHLWDKYNSN